jgi:DNA-binding transcriptional LysR family regulator
MMFEKLFEHSGLSMDRLRTLCEVVEAGGIAKAAPGDPARQSLFSRQIRELESFFGLELLRRRGKGIEITVAGAELATAARDHFSRLGDFLKASSSQPVEFHVAAGGSLLEWLVIPFLASQRDRLPKVSFRFSDMRSQEIVAALREHRVDFGILRSNALAHPIKQIAVRKMGYRIFAPNSWAARIQKDLSSVPMAILSGGEFRVRMLGAAQGAGMDLQEIYSCQSFAQCAQFVKLGAAAAILPDIAILEDSFSFQPKWLTSYRRDIALAWHGRVVDFRPMAADVASVFSDMAAAK